jgi:two-component sensor histidine kinase
MPHRLVKEYLNLTEAAEAFLEKLEQQMSIVADLSRADILLYAQKSSHELIVLAHAQPHSLAHVYSQSRTGRVVSIDHRPEILRVLTTGKACEGQRSFITEGAPVVRQTFPVYFPPVNSLPPEMQPPEDQAGSSSEKPQIIAALVIVTNLLEYERHRLRSPVFKQALKNLQLMLLSGHVIGAEMLSPFGEQDGILITDNDGIIQYVSGIAANLYRRVGYKETLAGRPLTAIETADEQLRRDTLAQKRALERDVEEVDHFWTHKTIPLISYPPSWSWLKPLNLSKKSRIDGVLFMLHDDTESRRQDQEMRIKNAMIQEVHHRVKNNLQTIAGLLRMQARRVQSEEARSVLEETLSRILSVAVIHEFLSSDSSNIINIKEVSNRIVSQLQYGMLSPDDNIRIEVTGEPISLPARQATSCALIINELVQNAIEHGFEHKKEGVIRVNLEDNGDEVIINVADTGEGVPGDFRLEKAESLGLQIVRILVEGDLKGQIQVENGVNDGAGLSIKIIFPKTIFRGEAGWKEPVSL